MNEPANIMPEPPASGLQCYQSFKRVHAGKITEVVPAGCFVAEAGGITSVLRLFPPNMTARWEPVPGDYWVVYEDGYQSISPKAAFEGGYVAVNADEAKEAVSMNITARMTAQTVTSQGEPKQYEQILLVAVYSDDPTSPNYAYSQATPCARMDMTITNPGAWGAFVEGQSYDLLFTPTVVA